MSVNIFGCEPVTTATTISRQEPPGIRFKYLDDEGNFDIEDKRLANVVNSLEKNDVVTKIYTDNLIRSKVDEISPSTEIINEALTQLQMKYDKININIENKLDTLKMKITELKSEDDHIKNFVEEMKSLLFDIHNNVLTKEGFESFLKMINKQISTLEKNSSNIQVFAYETIIFKTISKLELDKFPFVLGIKSAASKKTGYIISYDGFIDTIILASQDIDQHVSVKLLINGNEYYLPLYKYGDEFKWRVKLNL